MIVQVLNMISKDQLKAKIEEIQGKLGASKEHE